MTNAPLTAQNQAKTFSDQGFSFYYAGRTAEAEVAFKNALQLAPEDVATLHALSVLYYQQGRFLEAFQYLDPVVQKGNVNSVVHVGYAAILRSLNRNQEAEHHLRVAMTLDPINSGAYNNYGNLLRSQSRHVEAIRIYTRAIVIDPLYSAGHHNLANAALEHGEHHQAVFHLKCTLLLDPKFYEGYYILGHTRREQGRKAEAILNYERALKIQSNHVASHWARCMAELPILYEEGSLIHQCRTAYRNRLAALHQHIPLTTPQEIEMAATAVGTMKPFYLSYQGLVDVDLQGIYGTLASKIMTTRYKHWNKAPAVLSNSLGESLRIGIATQYFHLHSVWKIIAKGWMEHLDKRRFTLYGYHLGSGQDQHTVDAARCCAVFHRGGRTLEAWAETIRKDQLNMLIYPEIGMDPMAARLATLKLARRQAMSWGHPVTSGFPTMDFFLSSDLMEPPDGGSHYTEQLIRLPNLSTYYVPVRFHSKAIDRATLGARPNTILYWCCQSLFKYLPWYDEVFPKIAKEVGDCQFLFIKARSETLTQIFQQRLSQAFLHHGLDSKRYCLFIPGVPPEQFEAISKTCDVFLDSIGWSGGNTTFEALDTDLPVVTLPGSVMRSRHSMAILTMMGLTETIACSVDHYVSLAVRLGKEHDFRLGLREAIRTHKERAYTDMSCVKALETFLETHSTT